MAGRRWFLLTIVFPQVFLRARTSGNYCRRYRLRGTEIPLGSRLITVADAYDALQLTGHIARRDPVMTL